MEHRSGKRQSGHLSGPEANAYDDLWVCEPGRLRGWFALVLRASATKVTILGTLGALCYIAKLLITTQGLTLLAGIGGLGVALVIVGFGLVVLWMIGHQEIGDAKASKKIQDRADESRNERGGEKDTGRVAE